MNKKYLIIVSGGMDSVTLLYDLVNKVGNKNVLAISYKYGSRHMNKEIPCAIYNCKKLKVEHKIIDIREVFNNFKSSLLDHKDSEAIPEGHYESKNMKKTIVPFRNGILLSIAAGIAETIKAKFIYYGAHGGDHAIYEDCRKEFVDSISQSIKLGTMNKIQIRAPYWNINKTGILKKGLKLKVDYSKTWTCYNPNKKGESCGLCGSCQERLTSWAELEKKDPLNYVSRELIKK